MDYNELYSEYMKLLEETQKFRKENEDLRIQLGLQIPEAYLYDKESMPSKRL